VKSRAVRGVGSRLHQSLESSRRNGMVYATVPATSTQGTIKAEDKAKQAVGGVQLCRLSFPPTCDVAMINDIITMACEAAMTSRGEGRRGGDRGR